MAYLIKAAKIICKHSPHHGEKMDILIEKGKIKKISKRITGVKAETIQSENLHVSIGWFDIGTHVGEPGYEQRETLETLDKAAASGGYTGLAIFPKTKPVIQHKKDTSYYYLRSQSMQTDVFPIAALSVDCKGEDLTEFIDLKEGGAIAYSDGLNSVKDDGLLERALNYSKSFGGKVIHTPQNKSLNQDGQVHEGQISISLGLSGLPELSEKTSVQRDLNILEYTEGQMIFHCLSSSKALEVLSDSEMKAHYEVTIPYLNLVETDEVLLNFDENYKVMPPLRDEHNRSKLIKAVKSKLVDAIVSNHVPLEIEEKENAFPFTEFGATGLQTCFAKLNSLPRKELSLELIIEKLSSGPRRILKLEIPQIEEGEIANLCIFDPNLDWELNGRTNHSKSKNNPYFGKKLRGKVLCTMNNNKTFFNN